MCAVVRVVIVCAVADIVAVIVICACDVDSRVVVAIVVEPRSQIVCVDAFAVVEFANPELAAFAIRIASV